MANQFLCTSKSVDRLKTHTHTSLTDQAGQIEASALNTFDLHLRSTTCTNSDHTHVHLKDSRCALCQ